MSQEKERLKRFPFHQYMRFARRFAREAMTRRPPEQVSADRNHRPDPGTWSNQEITAAWLGHATVLINFLGTWILTDPVLARRIGIRVAGMTLGPRRLSRPALSPGELPHLDLILISHAHMDHLDLGTLRRVPRNTRVITHRGVSDLLRRFHRVDEVAWGERVEHAGMVVEGIGARHWGARTITDQQRGYGGFLLEKSGHRILFAGDTAYTTAYRALAPRGSVNLAILPIGAYDPWIANHASPEEAWSMGQDMRAQYILPIHHSTFRLSREPVDEPFQRFMKAAGGESWRIAARSIGETWRYRAP
jgi:L-ascorbate metabolism protein UlaG (beta-lactamase superfamily)